MTALQFKQLRKKCGLTQETLADTLGVTRQTITAWEANEPPKIAQIALTAIWSSIERAALVESITRFVSTSTPTSNR